MTMRLSASSLAGTARTLVAVGTVSETFMFLTTAAAAPRRGDWSPAAIGVAGALAAGAAGFSAAGALGAAGLGAGSGSAAGGGSRGAVRRRLGAVRSTDGATRTVVGEELVPGLVHAGGVGEVLLVHLLDQ